MSERIVVEFCGEMLNTRSTKQKKEILTKYSNEKIVVSVLKFLLDKTPSGMTLKRLSKATDEVTDCTRIESLEDAIQYLTSNNSGEDCDIALIQEYLNSLSEEYKEIVTSILTKDLRLGVEVKTVSTVIPEFNQKLNLQYPVPFSSVKLNPEEWICVSEIVEGTRAVFMEGKLLSSDSSEIKGMEELNHQLSLLASKFPTAVVFDGVLDACCESFIITDIIPHTEFIGGESISTYQTRYQVMEGVRLIAETFKGIHIVNFLYEGTDHSMIKVCLETMYKQSKNGCIVARDVTYRQGQNDGVLEVSVFTSITLPCVKITSGTGSDKDKLRSVVVSYKDSLISISTGFNEQMRKWIWENKQSLIGKPVELKYREISRNNLTGGYNLLSPVFVRFQEQ